MKKSKSRIVAQMSGVATYVPEFPCARGHLLRSTANGRCIACRRMSENARVAANRETYNARKKAERSKYRAVLAEKARSLRANETPEARAERLKKAKIKQREWRAKNPGHENTRKVKAQYKKNNPDKRMADVAKRRAYKLQRTPIWLNMDDLWMMEQAYDLATLRSKLFGFRWHVDHILPLQGKLVSGLHVPFNLQVIPWLDNVSKANKYLPA